MLLRLLSLTSALVFGVSARHIECDYRIIGAGYSCHLIIFDEIGFDDYSEIAGVHLEGRGNGDVTSLYPLNGTTLIVPRIICQTFPNLNLVDLSSLGIGIVTEESFSGCEALDWLRLWNNKINELPLRTFERNLRLTYLDLDGNDLQTLPEDIFVELTLMRELELNNNELELLPSGIFRSFANLQRLDLSNCNISHLNPAWFANLTSLLNLNIFFNSFSSISEQTFASLVNLETLDFSQSLNIEGVNAIHPLAFDYMRHLTSLTMNNVNLRAINPMWFRNTPRLTSIYMNFNSIDHIPEGTFGSLDELTSLNFWSNSLKVVRRSAFGRLDHLRIFDIDFNAVAAMDREIIDDAIGLFTLYFDFNVCASRYMGNFLNNREEYILELEECFANGERSNDAFTLTNQPYAFHSTSLPGVMLHVRSQEEVHIAITPFDFPWQPMLEVIIGAASNTRSIIRRNLEEDVVTVKTPDILQNGQWSAFRITWMNHVLMVFREYEEWPFMVFTMRDFFNVNFYGLRSGQCSASWFVLPL